MKTRVIIINPMQSPPGVWMARGRDSNGKRCVAFKREEAQEFVCKSDAEIAAQRFVKEYPKRGNETLAFMYIESVD